MKELIVNQLKQLSHVYIFQNFQYHILSKSNRFYTTKKCMFNINTSWKASAIGVFLVRIFPHLDWKNSEYGHISRSEIPTISKTDHSDTP